MSPREYHEEHCAGVELEQAQYYGEWWNRCTGCGFKFSDRDLDAVSLILLAVAS